MGSFWLFIMQKEDLKATGFSSHNCLTFYGKAKIVSINRIVSLDVEGHALYIVPVKEFMYFSK